MVFTKNKFHCICTTTGKCILTYACMLLQAALFSPCELLLDPSAVDLPGFEGVEEWKVDHSRPLSWGRCATHLATRGRGEGEGEGRERGGRGERGEREGEGKRVERKGKEGERCSE